MCHLEERLLACQERHGMDDRGSFMVNDRGEKEYIVTPTMVYNEIMKRIMTPVPMTPDELEGYCQQESGKSHKDPVHWRRLAGYSRCVRLTRDDNKRARFSEDVFHIDWAEGMLDA